MFSLIIGESAIFTIFVVAYVYYIGRSTYGPTPQILDVPVFNTICLLSSSVTIILPSTPSSAARIAFIRRVVGCSPCLLGIVFLTGTAMEWKRLIYKDGLSIRTNLFGTTFYSLVGLHATHVIVGLTVLSLVMIFTLARPRANSGTPSAFRSSRSTGTSSMRCGSSSSPSFTSWEGEPMADTIHPESEYPRGAKHPLPAPTAWPIVLAFGCTLAAAGLVTDAGHQHSGRRAHARRLHRMVSPGSAARAARRSPGHRSAGHHRQLARTGRAHPSQPRAPRAPAR